MSSVPSSTTQLPRTSLDAPEPADSEAATSLKRKKSRPRLPVNDEDDDEGTQADEEFGLGLRGSWVNFDGRRRSSQAGSGSGSRRTFSSDVDPSRRHSAAV